MTNRASCRAPLALASLIALLASAPAAGQVCEPLQDGRLAGVAYQPTAIVWQPVVEFERMVLTIAGPCEDLVKAFSRGEAISFDVGEIQRVADGSYTWELRREAAIDPATRQALADARASGDESVWWDLFQAGAIPAGPYVDSGSFTVERGLILDPTEGEEEGGAPPRAAMAGARESAPGGPEGPRSISAPAQVISDDLIVKGRACFGPDCASSEGFLYNTILLKDRNTRIRFNDTSGGTYPTNNWQIRANSFSRGGANFLGFVDQGATGSGEGGARVFTVEAGARGHALVVDKGGEIGVGTSTPVLDLHVVTGDTPALRLEQSKAGGFTPQIWDIAGNETNFFIRDFTSSPSSPRLPFRIRPGAPSSSLDIASDGRVGIGTSLPQAPLHVRRSDGTSALHVEETAGIELSRSLARFTSNGTVTLRFTDTQGTGGVGDDSVWLAGLNTDGRFLISPITAPGPLWTMDAAGNVAATSFNPTSTRAAKEGFEPVDAGEILTRLAALPIAEWQYKNDPSGARHVGPTAEDFRAAFGLAGADLQHLSLTDLSGVALLAIQGLHQALEAKDEEVARLEADNRSLAARLERLEDFVSTLVSAEHEHQEESAGR
jgi:hypothetical protein